MPDGPEDPDGAAGHGRTAESADAGGQDGTTEAGATRARGDARLVLLRHGETEWSRSGRHTSTTDLPLTPAGERQARRVGAAIGGHDYGLVLASPRQRARRTAELVGASPIETEPDLAEWDYGAYEGLTSEQIRERLGTDWNLWLDGVADGSRSGGTPGETADEVRGRVDRVIARVAPVLDAGRDVLAVAHGHVLRALVAAWLDLPSTGGIGFTLSTGTVSELGFEHGRRAVLRWNCPPENLPEM